MDNGELVLSWRRHRMSRDFSSKVCERIIAVRREAKENASDRSEGMQCEHRHASSKRRIKKRDFRSRAVARNVARQDEERVAI